jgi:hypothetical protein
MGGLVGGWAGGEKELKDWAAVPFSSLDPQLRSALDKFAKKPEGAPSVRSCWLRCTDRSALWRSHFHARTAVFARACALFAG